MVGSPTISSAGPRELQKIDDLVASISPRYAARVLRPRACHTQPTVTVIIPCYRYGRYLPEVVATTLAQPGVLVDIIIVDDASPDGSADVARTLANRHENVSLIAHRTNRGHIATYNDGFDAASGKYVVLLSADDLLSPGALGRATALMEWHPEVSFVYGYAPDFTDAPPKPLRRDYSWSIWSSDQWIRRVCSRGSNVVASPEVVMRRDVMDELGGYDADLPHSADLLTWLRAAARGAVGRVNGPDQAYYRIHGGNMHITGYSDVLIDFEERRRAFETFILRDLANHPGQKEFLDLVHRGMAVELLRWAIQARETGEGGSTEAMQTYADKAIVLWPPITSTRLWSRFSRRSSQAEVGYLAHVQFKLDWELRHKLRWRRWRRFGV